MLIFNIAKLIAFSLPVVLMTATHSAWVKENKAIIGVNVVNPHRLSLQDSIDVLDNLTKESVKAIRVPLPPHGHDAETREFLRQAAIRGIGVLLIVSLEYPANAPVRRYESANPQYFGGHPLSFADPELFRAAFSEALTDFAKSKIDFLGFELANEINWAAFNPEFPIPGEHKILSYEDLLNDNEGRQIAAGFRQYIKVLSAMKDVRDASKFYRKTPIIVAGLSDPGPSGPRPEATADAVAISATVRYLRSLGADRLADAFGIHTYMRVPVGANSVDYAEMLAHGPLSMCGNGVACWLTEWGVSNPDTSCPGNEEARTHTLEIVRGALDRLVSGGRLDAAFYYSWNSEPWSKQISPLSVFRCGGVASGAKGAIRR